MVWARISSKISVFCVLTATQMGCVDRSEKLLTQVAHDMVGRIPSSVGDDVPRFLSRQLQGSDDEAPQSVIDALGLEDSTEMFAVVERPALMLVLDAPDPVGDSTFVRGHWLVFENDTVWGVGWEYAFQCRMGCSLTRVTQVPPS